MKISGHTSKMLLWACLIISTFVMTGTAHATDQKDLAVAEKTLPLLQDKLSGNVNVAIIYDPAVSTSKADADAIKAALEGNSSAAGATLVPVMVTPTELSKLGQAKLALVAYGMKTSFDAIATAAATSGTLTISADLECVKANKCVLGVVSSPTVDIYYSKTAADAGKIVFAPAFTMLVKQI
ncbi:MAG: hypothetical protein JO126_00660 [Alphaproteobacteria bacterium]|nr:hypothetical protein [Alphaproteobacteria bacterium]MBV8547949.1 hypothetical protein [Alphaproteobacteria bacterium]